MNLYFELWDYSPSFDVEAWYLKDPNLLYLRWDLYSPGMGP